MELTFQTNKFIVQLRGRYRDFPLSLIASINIVSFIIIITHQNGTFVTICIFSRPVMSDSVTPGTEARQASLSLTISWSLPISCQLHQWCHPAISSSDILFSFCPQSFPASGTVPMSQLFTSDDQSIGVSTSASVFLMSVQGWFPLRLTGLIPCCPKDSQESSPVPQFQGIYFSALHLLYSPSLTIIHDHWEDYSLDYTHLCWKSNISASQHTV